MTTRSHLLQEFALFGLMAFTVLGSLAYAWGHWRPAYLKKPLPLWRLIVANIGLIGVTTQALLFFLFWTPIGHDPKLIGYWARWVNPAFFVAVPCVLGGKGTTRWLLLSVSILLFAICFLLTLTA